MIAWLAVIVSVLVVAPIAFATVSSLITDRPASVARCASSWNGPWLAPRTRVSRQAASYAVVETTIRRTQRRKYRDCSIIFYGGKGTFAVTGRWNHGRVTTWQIERDVRLPSAPANALVSPSARLHLRQVGTRR